MYSLDIQNVSHAFDNNQVLKNIELKIHQGEIFGLLGPTGAGKTTLLKILTGQLRQQNGSAFVFEKDTKSLDLEDYEKFGMVLENVGIYERLSCYDNLLLFTKIYGIDKKNVDYVLKRVGLLEAKKTIGMNLSKGMRQRLALARAIIHHPKILFLDEPTSGLDPATVQEIHRLLCDLKDEGITIFMTTHNMVEATKLCHHVGLLHLGEIVEYGEPKEVCQRYDHQKNIHIQLNDMTNITLSNSAESADVISEYIRSGKLQAIHSSEPTLETVFIELTGRRFE